MKIGIISDTHEQVEKIKEAVAILKKLKPDFVVHCGDVISAGMIPLFEGLKMKIVLGNNNCNQELYDKKTDELGFEKITLTKEFAAAGKKFFVYHGLDKELLENSIKSKKYDYVLTGHTHKKRDEKIGKTRVINPGSLFSDENSIAVLDVKTDKLEFIDI